MRDNTEVQLDSRSRDEVQQRTLPKINEEFRTFGANC
jgi:hypothetical protein